MQAVHTMSPDDQRYENLSIFRDADGEAMYMSMDVRPRPCFTENLIRDFLTFQQRFAAALQTAALRPRCLVHASQSPGIFSLGGDLSLFQSAVETKNRTMLTRYAEDCARALHNVIHTPETVTISLLEGDALGAGLELALANDVVIAERGIRAGFPEVLFNLIPGHGAFYLVARRIGPRAAEKMIRDGNVYTAEELHTLGLIDILVDKGEGHRAVRDLLNSEKRSWNAYQALQLVKRQYLPITQEMLLTSANIWVNAVMCLTDRNLRMMERLVRAQEKRVGMALPAVTMPETLLQRVAA